MVKEVDVLKSEQTDFTGRRTLSRGVSRYNKSVRWLEGGGACQSKLQIFPLWFPWGEDSKSWEFDNFIVVRVFRTKLVIGWMKKHSVRWGRGGGGHQGVASSDRSMGRWSVQESTSQSPPDIPHSSSPQAFPTSYQKTKSLVIMKILLHYQRFRFIWLAKPAGRHFHKHPQLQTPLTLADFEAINRCEKPLPKNFNFAADVLDQWSQKEKV